LKLLRDPLPQIELLTARPLRMRWRGREWLTGEKERAWRERLLIIGGVPAGMSAASRARCKLLHPSRCAIIQ